MAADDLSHAARYLFVGLVLYGLLAVLSGRGIRSLEVGVFAIGMAVFLVVAVRLTD